MPFRCKYCGGYFCSEHRLPEMHNCTGKYQYSRSTTRTSRFKATGYSYTPTRRATRFGLFGETELRDLAIGLGVIILLPFLGNLRLLFRQPIIFILYTLIYGTAFIIHELAHKFTAQMMGYWAEFKINQQGLMLTLLSMFGPLKIIAPGAVMIGNITNWDHYGKVAAAGPTSNILLGLLFFILQAISGSNIVSQLAIIGMNINASLALFNLIPFGLFDGAKIIKWDRSIWGACVVASLLLFILA